MRGHLQNVSSKTENHKGFFVNRTTPSRFLSYNVSRLRSLLKFQDYAFLLASPNNCHGVSWVSTCLCLVVPVQTIRPANVDCVTNGHLQSGWRWRRWLFARVSNVVRIVSLKKHFWRKLKDVGGSGCFLILQEDRTRRIPESCAGPAIRACLRRLMEILPRSQKLCKHLSSLTLKCMFFVRTFWIEMHRW